MRKTLLLNLGNLCHSQLRTYPPSVTPLFPLRVDISPSWMQVQFQPLSTLPRPTFSLNPITRKPNPLLYNPQPVVTIRHQGWEHPPQGSAAGKALSQGQQWQLKLLSLGNNSSLSRKPWRMFGTIIIPRYSYTKVNWSPSKKISPRLRG